MTELDDTAEFPAVTDDGDVPGWKVSSTWSPDGTVTIEISELTEDELTGVMDAHDHAHLGPPA